MSKEVIKFPILDNIEVKTLMDRFDAYLVGGYVRDCFLKRKSKDIDICSIKVPEEIESLLKKFGYKFRSHGKSYGVFLVQLKDELEIELAAARRDYNHQGRHCQVEYVKSIEEDLARRDLTINALAVDKNGIVIDPFNGREDILKRRISFVGNPADRIEEDNLRALRALRFSYQLGFEIDSAAYKAINSYSLNAAGTQVLSAERIREEIAKILLNYKYISKDNWECFTQLLQSTGLPINDLKGLEQPSKFHEFDVYDHTERVVRYCAPILKLRLAALLHDTGKPNALEFKEDGTPTFPQHEVYSADIAKTWLTSLKFSNEVIDDVVALVKEHMRTAGETNKSKIKLVNKFRDIDVFKLWGLLRVADRLGKGDRTSVEAISKEISLIKSCVTLKEDQPLKLAISGLDVMDLFQIKPGKEVGKLLNSCKDLVMDNPVNNDRETLMAHLKSLQRRGESK